MLIPEALPHSRTPVSKLTHRTFNKIYQVAHLVSPTSYVLRDPNTGENPTEFKNPINLDRLIAVNLFHLNDFGENGTPRRIDVRQEDGITFRRGTVLAHGYAGAMKIRWEDSDSEKWIDLPKTEYPWGEICARALVVARLGDSGGRPLLPHAVPEVHVAAGQAPARVGPGAMGRSQSSAACSRRRGARCTPRCTSPPSASRSR